ncbi:MAG: hypothetical protein RLZZ28_675 [Bacteroidota bacterium]
MKALFLSLLLVTGFSLLAQTQGDIGFAKTSHQFGKIRQNIPATYLFSFTNNGSKPAVIEFANAECGCTTPEYSKDPILKGKSSTIKVTYNAANTGAFKKNVNIKFVGMNLPIVLTIEGEVVAKGK